MSLSSTQDLVGSPTTDQHTPHPTGYGTTDNAPGGDDDVNKSPSLRRKLQQLKEKSTGHVDLMKNVLMLMFGHCIWTIVLFFTLTVPIAMLVIASIRFHDCPRQPLIPIIMIIMGSLMMLSNILNLAHRFKTIWDFTLPNRITILGFLTIVINLCCLICFITGCVWVYGIYPPSFDPSQQKRYCDKTLYLFSFWILTTVYIFLGSVVVIAIVSCFFAALC